MHMVNHILWIGTFEWAAVIFQYQKSPLFSIGIQIKYFVHLDMLFYLFQIEVSLGVLEGLLVHVNFRKWKHIFIKEPCRNAFFKLYLNIGIHYFCIPVANKIQLLLLLSFKVTIQQILHNLLNSYFLIYFELRIVLPRYIVSLILHTVIVPLSHEFIYTSPWSWIKVPTNYDTHIQIIFVVKWL